VEAVNGKIDFTIFQVIDQKKMMSKIIWGMPNVQILLWKGEGGLLLPRITVILLCFAIGGIFKRIKHIQVIYTT
jgi:hypothetical protein